MNIYHEAGIYIIRDEFFERFPNTHWTDNKNESRPYYYAIIDRDGIMWMVPITSKVEKVREKIKREEEKRGKGNCIYYHIGIVAGKERGFKISEMFPITQDYVLHNYTINGQPYFIGDSKLKSAISTKARKYLSLLENRSIHPSVDVLNIKSQLLK